MQALFIGLKGVGTLFSVVLLMHCLVHFAVNLRLPDTKSIFPSSKVPSGEVQTICTASETPVKINT